MLLIHLLYSWLVLITCTVVAQSEPITGPTPHDAGQLVFGPLDSHTKSGPRAGAQNHRVGEEGDQAFFPTIARKEVCFRDVYSQPDRYDLLFAHQTPILDAHGVVVLVSDGVIDLANGTRAYKVDHCYPQDEPISGKFPPPLFLVPESLGLLTCPHVVYDYLAMCPFEDRYSEPSWDRGIRLARWDKSLPVFDEPSFLQGFILPHARADNMALFGAGFVKDDGPQSVFEGALEGRSEYTFTALRTTTDDTTSRGQQTDEANSDPASEPDDDDDEDEQPFDPQALEFDEADFAFFSSFENGYPGRDGCDEHGCWSRRIVTGS